MNAANIKKAVKTLTKKILTNYKLSTNALKLVTKNIDYIPISRSTEIESMFLLGFANLYDSLPFTLNNAKAKDIIQKKSDKYIKIILQDTKLDLSILSELGQNQADALGLYFVYGKDTMGEEFSTQAIKNTRIFKALKRHDFSSVSKIMKETGFNVPSGTITNDNKEIFKQIEDLRDDYSKLFDKFVDKTKLKVNL
ncbi:MAG: hypothetical protein WC679_02115 [Bacteroidales bacterium]|jgi:hypothetical protein